MSKPMHKPSLTRREMLALTASGAASIALPQAAGSQQLPSATHELEAGTNLYAALLKTWCDGLLTHQLTMNDPALSGALLCPACGFIHGRCGDAVYPLLRVARTTGESRYIHAAIQVHEWSERTVSRADGSWINDLFLSNWQGITVFHSIALGEALEHHGTLLDLATRSAWTARLARAAKFLDGFISIETGNINYPVTASYAFALCGHVLGEHRYLDRARKLAHATLDCFTPVGLLYGEGHPIQQLSPKQCRPVDLGYNVEESLPALALYATLTGDRQVLDETVKALRAHMEFLLPDGAWDNSWGTRNYKWSWWGSRTSDGCHPAFTVLAEHDPRFREAALRNLELMSRCTHKGLLYGGPDYFAHGDLPCIHHTFTHAKALATVLDRAKDPIPATRTALPRDEAYPVRSFPDIGTHLASIGPWRATVTEYDWDYVEHVQAGSGGGGGHVTGGTLSLLYHQQLGPVLSASMTAYTIIELSNQQVYREGPHMELAPRIELATEPPCMSVTDNAATLTSAATPDAIHFTAEGRLLSVARQSPSSGDLRYRVAYRFTASGVQITARVEASSAPTAPLHYLLPVVATSLEPCTQPNAQTVTIAKPKGKLIVRTNAAFDPVPAARSFNLVPGFECVPLAVAMKPGEEITLTIEATI